MITNPHHLLYVIQMKVLILDSVKIQKNKIPFSKINQVLVITV